MHWPLPPPQPPPSRPPPEYGQPPVPWPWARRYCREPPASWPSAWEPPFDTSRAPTNRAAGMPRVRRTLRSGITVAQSGDRAATVESGHQLSTRHNPGRTPRPHRQCRLRYRAGGSFALDPPQTHCQASQSHRKNPRHDPPEYQAGHADAPWSGRPDQLEVTELGHTGSTGLMATAA